MGTIAATRAEPDRKLPLRRYTSAMPRRVLMTADTVGGVWTYSLELTRALLETGIEVALATMGAPLSDAQWREARRLPKLRVFESSYKLEWMEQPWADVQRAGEWLLNLEAQWQPDVVHLNGYAHGALPWQAPVIVVGHSCVLSWWQAVKRESAPNSWEQYRQTVTKGLAAADLVIAPTAAMLQTLKEHYGPLPNCRVIFNGRAVTPSPTEDKETFIFAAGRFWDEAKNLFALETVAPNLAWPIYVAGETQHPDGNPQPALRLRLLGQLPPTAVAQWMRRAAVFAAPAHYEPFGLAALEAGLAGCALVLGDIASLREVWGESAIFVPPHDTAALREVLQNLVNTPAWRSDMATRARARALEFSPQRMAARYRTAYADVLTLKKRPEERRCES